MILLFLPLTNYFSSPCLLQFHDVFTKLVNSENDFVFCTRKLRAVVVNLRFTVSAVPGNNNKTIDKLVNNILLPLEMVLCRKFIRTKIFIFVVERSSEWRDVVRNDCIEHIARE